MLDLIDKLLNLELELEVPKMFITVLSWTYFGSFKTAAEIAEIELL